MDRFVTPTGFPRDDLNVLGVALQETARKQNSKRPQQREVRWAGQNRKPSLLRVVVLVLMYDPVTSGSADDACEEGIAEPMLIGIQAGKDRRARELV